MQMRTCGFRHGGYLMGKGSRGEQKKNGNETDGFYWNVSFAYE